MANIYHIEFGEEKSKVMTIEGKTNIAKFNLGDMTLKICQLYKYLGLILISKNNLDDHIKRIRGKSEMAYQTILRIAGNEQFKDIEINVSYMGDHTKHYHSNHNIRKQDLEKHRERDERNKLNPRQHYKENINDPN